MLQRVTAFRRVTGGAVRLEKRMFAVARRTTGA
jgi:hypothetical protein